MSGITWHYVLKFIITGALLSFSSLLSSLTFPICITSERTQATQQLENRLSLSVSQINDSWPIQTPQYVPPLLRISPFPPQLFQAS